MIPRPILIGLVFTLPVLIVCFAVTAGGHVVLSLSNDLAGTQIIRGVCLALMLAVVSNLILLIGALGFNAIAVSPRQSELSMREIESEDEYIDERDR